jgi:hypothetical protein
MQSHPMNHSNPIIPDKRSNDKHSKSGLRCKYCSAVYQTKRWLHFEDLDPKYMGELKIGVCPSCHKEHGHLSDGILTISGKFTKDHKEEIVNLIENTAKREEKRDVENRIDRIDQEDPNKMIVYTSKNMLAILIGKKLNQAYKGGKLDYSWAEKDDYSEIKWVKED